MAIVSTNFASLAAISTSYSAVGPVWNLKSALTWAQAAYDNALYGTALFYTSQTSTFVAGTLNNSHRDVFSATGSNLLDYPNTVTRLDYQFTGTDISTVFTGAVSRAYSGASETGTITGIQVLSTNFGRIDIVGNDNVAVYGDNTISSVTWTKGGLVMTATGQLSANTYVSGGYYYANVSGSYSTLSLTAGGKTVQISGVAVDPNILETFTTSDQLFESVLAGADQITGTSAAETLFGFGGDDTLNGGLGNDTLLGGTGSDTAIYSGLRSQYVILPTATGWTVTGPDGTDTLTDIEFVKFGTQSALPLANSAPTGVVTVSGSFAQNQTLSVTNSLNDANGLGAISYQWQVNGNSISGATAASFVLTQAQVGQSISVVASYTDQMGYATAISSTISGLVANVNDLPTGTVSFAGSATQGATLTASNNLNDLDGLGTITYQWSANGNAITGATNGSFVLTENEVGKTVTVTATFTDQLGTLESKTSSATAVIANVNDLPFGTVSMTGVTGTGQVLTATQSLGDLDGLGAITYQWRSSTDGINWAVIGSGDSLALSGSLIGKQVTVLASYTDGHGTVEHVASSPGLINNVLDSMAYVWNSHTLLSGVVLSGANHTATTDVNGRTALLSGIDSSVSLAVAREIPANEETLTAQAVNLQDAIAILKMIVGLDVNGLNKPLSPYQALAADFDGNGSVNLNDAIGVLRHVVGLAAPNPVWHFVNEADVSIPGRATLNPGTLGTTVQIALPLQNEAVHGGLVGILVGDVDGSFVGAPGSLDLDNINSTYFMQLVATHQGITLGQFGVYS